MFEFIETPFFTKAIERYPDDDDYAKLQAYLNEHPEAGAIVAGSGAFAKCGGRRRVEGNAAACG
jgi:hypothetical protein